MRHLPRITNGPGSPRPVTLTRPGAAQKWYRITNRTAPTAATAAEAEADVYLMDEIGGWGVTAQEFIAELRRVDAARINLHINSPGGDVFDGVAIFNALVKHRARITTYIDGLAASAASFIAMAGDEIVACRGSMLMIHDASGFCMGPAGDMREMADLLDKVSDTIAGIYAGRTSTSAEQWRAAMLATTWYTAAEAVEAGLVDRAEDTEDAEATATARAWMRTIFQQAGTSQSRPAAGPTARPVPGVVDAGQAGAPAAPVQAATAEPAAAPVAEDDTGEGAADAETEDVEAADGDGCDCPCDVCQDCGRRRNADDQAGGPQDGDRPFPPDEDEDGEDEDGEEGEEDVDDAACSCPCDACTDGDCDSCTEDCGRGKRRNNASDTAPPAAATVTPVTAVTASPVDGPLQLGTATDPAAPTRPSTTSTTSNTGTARTTDAWAALVARLVGPTSPQTADDVLAHLRGALL